MFQPVCRLTSVLLTLALCAGCSHFFEARAINRFAENLREQDLDGLKAATTPEFANKALRTAHALEDIKILRLPDGKTSIVEVEEVSPDHKRVTVQVGDKKKDGIKKEVFYELVRNEAGKWVVDDIYLKQKKQGVTAYKSVTEQMDLLLTVREFLDAWDGGDREQVLAVTSAELRAALEQLPPSYLAELTAHLAGSRPANSPFRPQAQLEDKLAVVRLPRKTGETVLTLRHQHEGWVVADVAIDTKEEKELLPSVHKLAIAVNTCTGFLEAYAAEDHAALQKLCDPDFYDGSLSVGQLKQVLLPSPQLLDHRLEAQLRPQRADLLLRNSREVVQIDLERFDDPEPDAPPQFKVREVTIYELDTRQEKRLSALFTAQEMLHLFAQALAERDLDHLRHCTTHDFSTRVWQRLNAATVQGLPLEVFDDPRPEIVSTNFQGSLTRIEVRQSDKFITYLLREEHGRFYVDDMLWQMPGRPASVKQTLEVLVPVQNFAAAIALGRDPAEQAAVLDLLRDSCSADFNRMVWNQTDFVPNSGLSADTFLTAPLASVTLSDQQILVKLGDEHYGANVLLRKENGRHVIDEIKLIAGLADSDRMEMKRTLRSLLAHGKAVRPAPLDQEIRLATPRQSRPIQQAVYRETTEAGVGEVWPADDVVDIGPIEIPPERLPPQSLPSGRP
jgi:hypothetical protein